MNIKWFLLVLLLTSTSFAQYAEPVEVVQTIETLPWSEVTTNEFPQPAGESIEDHIRNHPMLGDNLERLHEWLHQKIERLRPRAANGGAESTIFFEGTDAEFNAWKDRQSIESAGWKIVRLPPGKRLVNVVAIGKTHFSHAGHLTVDALRRFVTQFENRQFKPVKSAKARFVKTVKMITRVTEYVDGKQAYVPGHCIWCDRWMESEYAKAIADGAQVIFQSDPVGEVPRFEVCDENGQLCQQFRGFTTWTTLKGNK